MILTVLPLTTESRPQDEPVVRAVLFFSPTCPHCHTVINDDLPQIFDTFGGEARVWVNPEVPQRDVAFYLITNGTLEVLLVDASKPLGGPYYERTTASFAIPRERSGVPRLIVGETVLVGSVEIPEQFPLIIREALADDGLDWPEIEGLESEVALIPVEPTVVAARDSGVQTPDETTARPPDPSPDTSGVGPPPSQPAADSSAVAGSIRTPARPSVDPPDSQAAGPTTLDAIPVVRETPFDKFRRDPVGNGLSVVVLIGMIVSVVVVATRSPSRTITHVSAAIPVWAVAGVAVAAYLTFVEASGTRAVCGPVGDCNAVQQSPYATLFGVIPVGLAGLLGYVAIIATWTVARRDPGRRGQWARVALLAMTFVGTLFSIYLTFLEPFVIGATCVWCLSSAIIITVLLWLSAGAGTNAWAQRTAPVPSSSHDE